MSSYTLQNTSYYLQFTYWKCPKFRRCLPNSNLALLEIIDMGGHAMKAKIISMIITAIASIATVVSAIFAVLSYIKM